MGWLLYVCLRYFHIKRILIYKLMKSFFFPILCSVIGIILTTFLIVCSIAYSIFHTYSTWDFVLWLTILVVVDLIFVRIFILCKRESKLQNEKLFKSNTFKRF